MPTPHIFKNDFIVGSIQDMIMEMDEETMRLSSEISGKYIERGFGSNADHYATDYGAVLREGLPGMFRRIEESKAMHHEELERVSILKPWKRL